MPRLLIRFLVLTCVIAPALLAAEERLLESRLVHLRNGADREWTEFPEDAEATELNISFDGTANSSDYSLRLRQEDVKQGWRIVLNDQELGRLVRDENPMEVYFDVPAETLVDGSNRLQILPQSPDADAADDIRAGRIALFARDTAAVLNEATVQVEVVDEMSGAALPCRITILDDKGALQTPGAESSLQLAVRPGIVFTADGSAQFGLPAGSYTLYAGRGFEYSIASHEINLVAGRTEQVSLSIRREVPTPGYISCDTHVHTLTHSGHGDASIEERMITLAAECIELPIATDHNKHIDYTPHVQEQEVERYFTPVIGNEVTTRRGHFNIFPVRAGATVPDHTGDSWEHTLGEIFRTPDVKVAILNHARDVHSGVRPFGPGLYNALVADNLEDWPLRFNAMEVVNSGATQTDILQLFHDWMGLLNAGYSVTAVGSSDSHDVGRHFVGQGRTYIRCDDRDPGNLDVDTAVKNFLQGQALVSYGLLTELTVNGKYGPGETAVAVGDELQVDIRVLGPHWTDASRVMLYRNGQVVREEEIPPTSRSNQPTGVIWESTWTLPNPRHDVHLVAIAVGPGIDGLFWRTAKAYQPTSPHWEPHTIGSSGAVWLDADGDGRRSSARDYAQRLFTAVNGDLTGLAESLRDYDSATAAHAAHLFASAGGAQQTAENLGILNAATDTVQQGFRDYFEARRENEIARLNQ